MLEKGGHLARRSLKKKKPRMNTEKWDSWNINGKVGEFERLAALPGVHPPSMFICVHRW
jgi:hypothetical protein